MPIIEKEAKELVSGLNTQNSEVLGTIYLPRNLKVLGNKLPKPNYQTPARRAPSPEEIVPEVRTKETRNNASRQRRFSLGRGIIDDRESRISHPYTKKYGCNPVMKAREELKKVNMEKPILPPRPKYFPLFIISFNNHNGRGDRYSGEGVVVLPNIQNGQGDNSIRNPVYRHQSSKKVVGAEFDTKGTDKNKENVAKPPLGLKNEKIAQHCPPVIKSGHPIIKRASYNVAPSWWG